MFSKKPVFVTIFYNAGYVINLKSVIEAEFSVGLFTRSKSDFNFLYLFYLPA